MKKLMVLFLLVIFAGAAYLAVAFRRHGFSAREKPWQLEEFFARQARRFATPAGAREPKKPYPLTPESLTSAREHWVAHCSSCHGLDGSGNTTIGRNLYPKTPDMRGAATQKLSDGELFYIITNGIRFTGMPAWGDEHTPEETSQLVSFVRRLPHLSSEELREMERLASGRQEGQRPSAAKPHVHGAGGRPHKH